MFLKPLAFELIWWTLPSLKDAAENGERGPKNQGTKDQSIAKTKVEKISWSSVAASAVCNLFYESQWKSHWSLLLAVLLDVSWVGGTMHWKIVGDVLKSFSKPWRNFLSSLVQPNISNLCLNYFELSSLHMVLRNPKLSYPVVREQG